MSYQAVEWWLNHATVKGAQWQAGVVLATHADATGANAYPSKARIAIEAELDVRTVRHALAALKLGGWWQSGELSPLGTRSWSLNMDDDRFPAKTMPAHRGDTPQGSTAPMGSEPVGHHATGGRGNGATTPRATRPSEPSLSEPSFENGPRAGARGAEPTEIGLVEGIVGVLQRGIDGLTTDERGKPPTVAAVAAALREHPTTPEVAHGVAIEVRSIAQSQNRAPNIARLFAQRLAASTRIEEDAA